MTRLTTQAGHHDQSWTIEADTVAARLGTDRARELSRAEASERLARVGPRQEPAWDGIYALMPNSRRSADLAAR